MLEAGVHFGHRQRYWNPKMKPYIYGLRYQLHIIDLGKTVPLFEGAMRFVKQVASKNGRILWVGTKYVARKAVTEHAQRCDMPYINHRWLGGMLTNYKTIRNSVKRLTNLEELLLNERMLKSMTKKEILNLTREKDKLDRNLGGIKSKPGLPDALFVFDVGYECIAVKEANHLGIPVIGIVDTNRSPEGIRYLIPGNDDSVRAIELYATILADTIIEARDEAAIEDAARTIGRSGTTSSQKSEKVTVKTRRVAKKAAILPSSTVGKEDVVAKEELAGGDASESNTDSKLTEAPEEKEAKPKEVKKAKVAKTKTILVTRKERSTASKTTTRKKATVEKAKPKKDTKGAVKLKKPGKSESSEKSEAVAKATKKKPSDTTDSGKSKKISSEEK